MERIPGCWTEHDRVEFDRETLDGNTGFQLEILYLEQAFGTKYFIMDHVTGSMMGIYDNKVEQIDLKGQLKPFNINQLDRVMHILGQRRLGLDTSSIPTDDIPEESLTSTHLIEWSTPLHLNNLIYSRNIKMWSMTATCLQQTKELRYMKIGSRSLLKWLSHFTFFPGVFSSTQRWQTSILLVEINTSTISNRLCGTSISSCRRISWCTQKPVFPWCLFQAISPIAMIWSREMLTKSHKQHVMRSTPSPGKCK